MTSDVPSVSCNERAIGQAPVAALSHLQQADPRAQGLGRRLRDPPALLGEASRGDARDARPWHLERFFVRHVAAWCIGARRIGAAQVSAGKPEEPDDVPGDDSPSGRSHPRSNDRPKRSGRPPWLPPVGSGAASHAAPRPGRGAPEPGFGRRDGLGPDPDAEWDEHDAPHHAGSIPGLGDPDDLTRALPDPDLGEIVVILLVSTLAGLRDRLERDGFQSAAALVHDLVEVADDYVLRFQS
ncbi:MAG TPA: hypothetical protein VIG64_06810 [Actinomycetota bacterium]